MQRDREPRGLIIVPGDPAPIGSDRSGPPPDYDDGPPTTPTVGGAEAEFRLAMDTIGASVHTLRLELLAAVAQLVEAAELADQVEALTAAVAPAMGPGVRTCPTCHSSGSGGTPRHGCQDLWHIEVRSGGHRG